MKNKRYTKKQLHKKKCRAIMGFITTLLLLCLASSVLVAKYYAGRSNKGVAIASSLYFSSNVLKNVKNESGGVDDSNYPIIYNTTSWDGTGACRLDVQIRNYQNQLLYNDRNLDITYNICFELAGVSDGGTYQISYGSDTKTLTDDNKKVQFSNITLQGGMARADQFMVSVTRPESEKDNPNYRSTGIRVTATPVSPSYVTASSILGGILYASIVSAEYSLNANFDVNGPLNNYSGFPCTITYMPGVDNKAHEVKVIWDSKLEIDQFDPYYQQAKNEDGKYDEIKDSNDDVKQRYIILTMQPYSSIQITFYRADGFADESSNLNIVLDDLTLKAEGSE